MVRLNGFSNNLDDVSLSIFCSALMAIGIFWSYTISKKVINLCCWFEFTDQTLDWINKNSFNNGILNLSIQHTSASLIVQENDDPDVQSDLINYFDKIAPMNNKLYIHTIEGNDYMPAHIKSALTNNQISLSIKNKQLLLGTWQGIYLFEHRLASTKRLIIHHFIGD